MKFVFEISKKMLIADPSTFMRAVEVGVLGIVTDSLPSLAVLAGRGQSEKCCRYRSKAKF